jgi:hypothetical protein
VDTDALFGLPLDQFVPERTALAKSLRAEGRRDEAAEVAKTRKPSVAAWAVNQLVRTQRGTVADLFEAGDAARDAQEAMLSGRGDAATLRAATAREREAVDELLQTAKGLLSSEGQGLSPAVVDRVSETLHAAALEPAARDAVRDGCLERELRHVGFGGDSGLAFAAPPAASRPKAAGKTPTKASGKAPTKAEAVDRERGQRAEARRLERERADAVTAARVAESDARHATERAVRAVELAEDRRARAAQALEQADDALDKAKAESAAAAAAHGQAETNLKQLKG